MEVSFYMTQVHFLDLLLHILLSYLLTNENEAKSDPLQKQSRFLLQGHMTWKCSDLMEAENISQKRSSIAVLSPKGRGIVCDGLFVVCTSAVPGYAGSRCLFIWYTDSPIPPSHFCTS